MRSFAKTLLNFGNGSTGFQSEPFEADQLYAVSVQLAAKANFSGTLILQATNAVYDPFYWDNIASVTLTNQQLAIIPCTRIAYKWIRVEWIRTAGFGELGLFLNAQGA